MCFFADDHRKIDIEIDEVERTPLHLYNVVSISLSPVREISPARTVGLKSRFRKDAEEKMRENCRGVSGRVKTARVGWDAKPRKKMSS